MSPDSSEPIWHHYEKIAFRFFFTLFLIFILFFNNGAFSFLRPFSYLLLVAVSDLVSWVGLHILSLQDVTWIKPNGSGDTTYNYVLLFCLFTFSGIVAIVWSALDWRRANYGKMFYWLTAFIRYYVGLMLIQYGVAKIMGGQFSTPDVVRLSQTYGESTPMGLAWTFFGYSAGYKWFMAIAEFSAVLLLFRRTMTAGAFIALGTSVNIMAINYFFDVPVKIISTALVIMCLFLLLPHARQLFRFFFLGQPASLPVLSGPFKEKWQLYTKHALKGALIIWTISLSFVSIANISKQYEARQNPSPLAGSHKVVEYKQNGNQTQNEMTWKELRLVGNSATLLYLNGSSMQCTYFVNAPQKKIEFFVNGPVQDPEVFIYNSASSGKLVLEGKHRQVPVKITLKRILPGDFRLMKTGFNWLSEVPNNR